MGGHLTNFGKLRIEYKIFVSKSKAKKSYPRPVNSSKISLEEIQYNGMSFIRVWV